MELVLVMAAVLVLCAVLAVVLALLNRVHNLQRLASDNHKRYVAVAHELRAVTQTADKRIVFQHASDAEWAEFERAINGGN